MTNSPTLSELVRLQKALEKIGQYELDGLRDFEQFKALEVVNAARNFDLKGLQTQYEAMRGWIQKAPHYSSCRSEWEGLPWEADAQCTCGLSALRASLDTKTRGDG